MPRALFTLLVAFSLVVACSKDEAPAMPASGPVGKVVELSGEVTAKRADEEPRKLAVSEVIYARDTVTTGADGSVAIVLEHNNARWTLAADKSQAVAKSMAARAKKQEGSQFEQAGDDTTVTAGRNVENETASTTGTLEAAETASAADEGGAPEMDSEAPGAPPRRAGKRAPAKNKSVNERDFDGLGLKGTGRGGGGTGDGKIGLGNVGTVGKGGGGGSGSGYGRGASGGAKTRSAKVVTSRPTTSNAKALPSEVIRRVVRQHANEIRYCYERELQKNPNAEGRMVLSFAISGRGTVVRSTTKQPKSLAAVGKCVASRARRWRFPKPKNGATVKVTFPFVLRKTDK